PSKPPPSFDFTRRKKWADLLITELSEAIVFVLSPQAKVLFCSHSVYELLGWKDDELVDRDLFEWIHAADHNDFRSALLQSQHVGQELLTYFRLRCKPDAFTHAQPPPAILFELYGRPHTVPGESAPRCLFAVAKPHPSRNTAMLNTFLELKVENARLQDRLNHLRAQACGASPTNGAFTAPAMQLAIDARDPAAFYAALGAQAPGAPGAGPGADDPDEDKARKRRKVAAPEQYVCNTCGRTDSPEWRKGPRGPKTLCNACGLRWAKKVRKFEEGGGEG
ncbi:hypothetical protein K488DRAFT_24956, partial [Vararia minispora EC-137]